jgi:hypothetical protein
MIGLMQMLTMTSVLK